MRLERRQLLDRRLPFAEHGADQAANFLHDQPEPRLGLGTTRFEGLRRGRQRFGQAGTLEGQFNDLSLQVVAAAQRHELHRHLGQAGDVLVEVLHLLPELQHEQARQALAVRVGGFLGGIEDFQTDRFAVVDQRRIADHGLFPDRHFHQFRQLAEGPVGQLGVFGRRFVQLGEFLLGFLAPFAAQRDQAAVHVELPAVFVDQLVVHREVRRQRVGAEGVGRHRPAARVEPARFEDEFDQRVDDALVELAVVAFYGSEKFLDEFRHRHQLGADFLRQRLDQLHQLFLDQARHQPFHARRRNLVELRQWQRQRHAIPRRARLEVISERVLHTAGLELVREGLGGDAGRRVAHQVVLGQEQQLGVFLLGGLAPVVEGGAVVDVFRNDVVVESEDQFVVDQHVLAALLVIDLLDLADLLLVVLEEGPALGKRLLDLLADQPLADKYLARLGWRQRAVMDAPLGVDDDPVERRALPAGDLHRLLFPVRIEVLALDEVSAHFLDPF